MKKLFLAFALLATPALAQPSPTERAYQQTVGELTQAWMGARTALIAAQDQLAIEQGKVKELEAKLPRQEPIRGPSAKPDESKAP